jgi:hypothetical protein
MLISNQQLTAVFLILLLTYWPGPFAGLSIHEAAPTQSCWRNSSVVLGPVSLGRLPSIHDALH